MVRTLGTLCTLVSLLTISTACQQKPAASVPVSAQHSADYFGRKIVVRAAGASTSQQTSLAQKRLWALTEARKNCITQAAAALGEIDIEGTTLLEAGRLRGQNIEISIQNYLRGIKDITEESNVLPDGSILATVTMVIYFDGNDGLNRLLYNSLFSGEQKPFPAYLRCNWTFNLRTGSCFQELRISYRCCGIHKRPAQRGRQDRKESFENRYCGCYRQ